MSLFNLRLFNPKYSANVRLCCAARQKVLRGISPAHMNQLENLMINQVLNKKKNITGDEWIKIREDLFASPLPVTKHNIDAAIVEKCCVAGEIGTAVNYIEFLISTNQKINLGTINKFFCAVCDVRKPLSEREENLIIKLYEDLKTEYPLLDAKTANSCIEGLSKTKRWKEYKELLHMTGIQSGHIVQTYQVIASAAFNHDDPDTAWEILKSAGTKTRFGPKLSDSYLDYCIRHSKNMQDVESKMKTLFEFFSEYHIHLIFECITKYVDYLEKLGWHTSKTKIDAKGSCLVCGHKLDKIQITPDDFDLLKQTFFSKVLVGNDVYCNSTPRELQSFQKFVASTKPYDVVIDGLNAAYLSGREKANRALDLAKVVEAFVKQNMKIFILGRKHMNRWRMQEMDYVKAHAHLYLADDLTNDDTLLLHAALSSGLQTYFCSRDFMRQHKFLLANDHIRRIFRSWQLTRQIYPTQVGGPHNKQYLLVYPTETTITPQMNPKGDWHIPYRQDEAVAEVTPPLWLCLQKPKNSHE